MMHEGVHSGTRNPAAGPPVAATPLPWSDTARGWTAGFGVEQAFGDRWVGRIDYRYSDSGDLYDRPFGPPGTANNFLGERHTHEVRVGIALRI